MAVRYAIAVVLWITWLAPFVRRASKPGEKAVVKNSNARWGIIFEGISYGIVWSVPTFDIPVWRIVVGTLFGLLGIVAAQTALRHLGKQWRIEAGLSEDHDLVRTGPYAIVRHPIYASMFAMLLAYGFLLARWPLFIAAIVLFVAGTEIRVHVEDNLLRSRFADQFEAYAHRVPAYIPYVR
jgi:protein-S-isoprenylcysteine O-methyltransferase Ste14